MLPTNDLREKARKLKEAAADLEQVLDLTNEDIIDNGSILHKLVEQYVEFLSKDFDIIQSTLEQLKRSK